jgi:hypothetical protein
MREPDTDLIMLLPVVETGMLLPHSRSMGWYWPLWSSCVPQTLCTA